MAVEPTIILAFLAGVVTIVTPCVLPILPPLLAGSVGSRTRPVLIVFGSMITFTLMGGLFSAIGVAGSGIGNVMRLFFIALIIGFGAVWVDDDINEFYTKYSSLLLNKFVKIPSVAREDSPFGAFVLGLSLGIVWIPCVGPILGAVLGLAAIKGSLVQGSFMLFSYSLGLGIPMLVIAYGGKGAVSRLEWTKKNSTTIKNVAGWILILTGLAMLFGFDQYIQTLLLPYFPEFETKLLDLV